MANSKHVEIVKQGAKAIAKFRKAHPLIRLDLSGADLSRFDLSRTNLSGADLSCAILVHTVLCDANLRDANFRSAIIRQTRFDGAFLTRADLTDANCPDAVFDHAILSHAICKRTKFCGIEVPISETIEWTFDSVSIFPEEYREKNRDEYSCDMHLYYREDCADCRHGFRCSLCEKASFEDTSLRYVDFSDAILYDDSQLEDANTKGANLSNAVYFTETIGV